MMDSAFTEEIIEKEKLYPVFKKLSYRVLSTDYSVADLYRTGEKDVKRFVSEGFLKDQLSTDMTMLEIGCGVGRLSRSFSACFKEVHAVDIDHEMVVLSRVLHRDRNNLSFHKVDGANLAGFEDGYFDYVFSYYVFQHIRDMRKIISYFNEIQRVLKPGGFFQIQVRGRLPGLLRNMIPICLYNLALKKEYDRYLDWLRFKKWHQNRGCRVSASMLEDLVKTAGLNVLAIKEESQTDLWVHGSRPIAT